MLFILRRIKYSQQIIEKINPTNFISIDPVDHVFRVIFAVCECYDVTRCNDVRSLEMTML